METYPIRWHLLSNSIVLKTNEQSRFNYSVVSGQLPQGTRPFQDHRSTAVVAGLGQLGLKKIDKIKKYHNSKQYKYCSVCPTKYTQLRESWERAKRELKES